MATSPSTAAVGLEMLMRIYIRPTYMCYTSARATSAAVSVAIEEMAVALDSAELLERAEELAVLRAAFSQASAGDARVVLVCGEAGIGKTSLVRRFCHEV